MLGASGRVGRAVRAVWDCKPMQGIGIVPVSRSAVASEGGVSWAPGRKGVVLPAADVVLAFWGVTRGDRTALAANTALAEAAGDLASRLGARQVIHCSSAAVYPPCAAPLPETAAGCSPSAYGQAKLDMEAAIAAMPGDAVQTVLRIGNVAGADALFRNLWPGGSVTLDAFRSGSGPTRSYIAPHDLATVVEALIREPFAGAVNVAAPQPTAMHAIAEATGTSVVWRQAPDASIETVHLDTTRLSAICQLPAQAADAGHLVDSARRSGAWP
jgi:nucleoside-diphosphate-sugar epimerase